MERALGYVILVAGKFSRHFMGWMYFSYTILANPEVEPHAPNTYQSKLILIGSINTPRTVIATNASDPHLGYE